MACPSSILRQVELLIPHRAHHSPGGGDKRERRRRGMVYSQCCGAENPLGAVALRLLESDDDGNGDERRCPVHRGIRFEMISFPGGGE